MTLAAIREARGNSELLCRMMVAVEVNNPPELDQEAIDELFESMQIFKYGTDWRRIVAERNGKISRGEPIKCECCGQMYLASVEKNRNVNHEGA